MGGNYNSEIVSVHDPDEYLAAATSENDREKRLDDIFEAYEALNELKDRGKVKAIGLGAKDWRIIKELTDRIKMDWVMFALSFTIKHHPPEMLLLIDDLAKRDIGIINSAVFHSGFLTGGSFFDYREVDPVVESDKHLYDWRDSFFSICSSYKVKPSDACIVFGLIPPGVISIALNTSKPQRVKDNVEAINADIPNNFWTTMKSKGLIDINFPYV